MKNLFRQFYLGMFCLTVMVQVVHGQVSYQVDGFSKDYTAQITFEDSTESRGPATVLVYKQPEIKPLIPMNSASVSIHVLQKEGSENGVIHIPYQKQSVVIFEDFNFDGKKDFALRDARGGCYSMPSYSFYLAADDGFQFSEAFTQMEHRLCNMFKVDEKTQTLIYHSAMAGGLGYVTTARYKVVHNKPKLILQDTYQVGHVRNIYSERKIWNGKKLVDTVGIVPGFVKAFSVFSFPLKKSNNRVVLLGPYIGGTAGRVSLAVIDSQNTVVTRYGNQKRERFYYDPNQQTLTSKNGRYIVFENNAGLVLKAKRNGKFVILRGMTDKVKGRLSEITNHQYKNLKVKQ